MRITIRMHCPVFQIPVSFSSSLLPLLAATMYRCFSHSARWSSHIKFQAGLRLGLKVCARVHNCTGMCGAVGAHISVFMPAWDYMRKLRKGVKNCFPFCFLGSLLPIAARILWLQSWSPYSIGLYLIIRAVQLSQHVGPWRRTRTGVFAGFLWWGYTENEEGNLTASLTKRWTQTILCILHLQNLLIWSRKKVHFCLSDFILAGIYREEIWIIGFLLAQELLSDLCGLQKSQNFTFTICLFIFSGISWFLQYS